MNTKALEHSDLFDDDEEPAPAPLPKRAIQGGDPAVFLDLVTRVPGLRIMPVSRDKIPLEKGWNGTEFWRQHADIKSSVRAWIAHYHRPNFAFVLGPYCGENGDLVIEADNQVGEDWCREKLPETGISAVTRHGFLHRHFQPDPPDPESGLWRGNMIDVFGSRKRHQQEALAAGYEVIVDIKRRDDNRHLDFVAGERQQALQTIPMGPLIDIKCSGGQAMCPGSVHATGHIYSEAEPWSLDAWRSRPTFDKDWFPSTVWVERDRQRLAALDSLAHAADRIDNWWTAERRYQRALAYVKKVPPKSTGENSSATAMRLATVLVRGCALEPFQARELMTYWCQNVCAHEPWSKKEIEHKLREANERGAMQWGEMLRDRGRNADARLEIAEKQIEDMLAGRAAVGIQDYAHELDSVELPADFEAAEPAEVVDIGHARLERDTAAGLHGATSVFDEDDEVVDTLSKPEPVEVSSGSQDQLRVVFAQFGIDLNDIRANNELYHTRTDRDGNIIGLDTTTKNVALVFKYSRVYKGLFKLNEMSEQQEFGGVRMTDAMDARLKDNIDGLFGREVSKERVRDGVLLACDSQRFNPVREYIDNLPEWDGVERWRMLPEHVMYARGNIPHAAMLCERFGFSAMARALTPGCKVDTMLVLPSSEQGLFKSTFGKTLFGEEFFSDQQINTHDKDSRMLISGFWCIEIGEGDIMSTPSDVKRFKAFLSQAVDDIRLPYARRVIRMPRRSVFIATTNENQFLHDSTGSRRFWIVEPGKKINLKLLRAWRDQLWAEAKFRVTAHLRSQPDDDAYIRGSWWLTDKEQSDNDANNAARQHEDAWEPDVYSFIESQGRNPFTVSDLLNKLNVNQDRRDWISTRRAVEILRRIGCTPYNGGVVTRYNGKVGRFWLPPSTLPGEQ